MPEVAQLPADPLAALNDTTRWHCERAIPVFKAHRRMKRGPDGEFTELYRVTEADLAEICSNANAALADDNHLSRHTIGHVLHDGTPEAGQPAVLVGAVANYRVGTFANGQACILADMYTRKGQWDEAKKYPYRSAEYNWATKRIAGVARLIRDPALGLGTALYADSAATVCYADSVDGTCESLNPDEAKAADRVWDYLQAKYPGLKAAAGSPGDGTVPDQRPTPPAQGEPDPEKPKPKAGGKPGEVKGDEEKTMPNAAETITVENYAALQAEVATLKTSNEASLATLRKELDLTKLGAQLDHLANVEKYQFDREDALTVLLTRDEAGRAKFIDNIKKNSKRLPTGTPTIPGDTTVATLSDDADKPMDTAEYHRALKLIAAKGEAGIANYAQAWAEVVEAVKADRKAK